MIFNPEVSKKISRINSLSPDPITDAAINEKIEAIENKIDENIIPSAIIDEVYTLKERILLNYAGKNAADKLKKLRDIIEKYGKKEVPKGERTFQHRMTDALNAEIAGLTSKLREKAE